MRKERWPRAQDSSAMLQATAMASSEVENLPACDRRKETRRRNDISLRSGEDRRLSPGRRWPDWHTRK